MRNSYRIDSPNDFLIDSRNAKAADVACDDAAEKDDSTEDSEFLPFECC
jgi:hypothetical protein